jgi:hypothetical protein
VPGLECDGAPADGLAAARDGEGAK